MDINPINPTAGEADFVCDRMFLNPVVAAHCAIFGVRLTLQNAGAGIYGASAFLLFVAPHSPMAQPWPVICVHLASAFIGVACAHWINSAPLAAAIAVLISIFVMHILHCLHPPSAATVGGPEVHAIGWQFCYEVVAFNIYGINSQPIVAKLAESQCIEMRS